MENENSIEQWYVVNTYAGRESVVKQNIEARVKSLGVEDKVLSVVVVEEVVPVLKDGLPTNRTKVKNVYPGYVFVKMFMSTEAWFVIRNTPGVTGFVGSSGGGTLPFPVPQEQMDEVLKKVGIYNKEVLDNIVGKEVKIVAGPYIGHVGVVVSINEEDRTAKIKLNNFGSNALECDFAAFERLDK